MTGLLSWVLVIIGILSLISSIWDKDDRYFRMLVYVILFYIVFQLGTK